MNKRNLLILLPSLLLCSCGIKNPEVPHVDSQTSETPDVSTTSQSEFDKWFNSDDAVDFDLDGDIDQTDFELAKGYAIWRKDPEKARDYTGDHRIKEDDYLFFVDYSNWSFSNDAFDYNDDKKIDENDYVIHLEYTKWLDSDEAKDLNNDRKIDYQDYLIYKNPDSNEYLKWLKTENAKDYDKDGKVTLKDFVIFNYFGTYSFANYTYSGSSIYIDNTDIDLRDIGGLLKDITLTYNENGLDITAKDNVKLVLGSTYNEIMNTLKTLAINITSNLTFNISLDAQFDDIPFEVVMYFEKGNIGYHTDYIFEINQFKAFIGFDLIKN